MCTGVEAQAFFEGPTKRTNSDQNEQKSDKNEHK